VKACQAQRAVLGLLLAVLFFFAPRQAHAQFATPTGNYAGTAGSSCAGLGQQYAWPDANGQILQCVSNVWTLVSPSSISSGVHLGTSTSLTNPARSASELNTGLFSPASGAIGIASLGTEQMRVTGGKVGIGTTPSNKFDVNGAVTVGYQNTSAPTNVLLVAGNVGIGTTPLATLDAYGSIVSDNYRANSATTAMTIASSGSVGIGSSAPMASLDLSQKTDATVLPVGTTGQQPSCNSGSKGALRYNSTTAAPEFCNGSAWRH
jgi:hypothetical protein